MHREDDSLLVGSTRSLEKQRSRDLKRPHAGEPYLRHMSRKKASPGKGLWAYEFEDPTTGGPLVHGARVRLRHACSGLYLAVRYSASPDRDPSAPELVALVGRDCRARSLFVLRSVKETNGDHVPAAGYACLVTHEVRSAKGHSIALCLRAKEPKPGKPHSKRIVFTPRPSILGSIEIHLAVGDEGFRLQTLITCRSAVERHARLIATVGADPASPRSVGDALNTRAMQRRVRTVERALARCVHALVGDGSDARASGDDAPYAALDVRGPPDDLTQSLAREVKLVDALVDMLRAVPAAGVGVALDGDGAPRDPRFVYLRRSL